MNNGLTNTDVHAIAVNGSYIFAGTMGSGVWRLPLNEMGIKEVNNESDILVYPNPVTNILTIENYMEATIQISNILGQNMRTYKFNSNKTSIDISAFPCGIYIIKSETIEGTKTKKFVKE